MLGTVYLHNQFCLGGIEINNIIANGFLPVKLHACKLFATHSSPQGSLTVGQVLSELLGFGLQIGVIFEHKSII